MRKVSRPPVFGVVAALAAAFFVCQPAHAQTDWENHSTRPLPKLNVRFGVFFPENSLIESQIGKTTYAAGLDYYADWEGPSTAYLLSVDYFSRLTDTAYTRLTPVTAGVIHYYSDAQETNRFYTGAGLGVYFDDLKYTDDYGFSQSGSKTVYGGYVSAGIDFSQTFEIDARYHIATHVLNQDIGGLELTAGVHF
ncbi:MAG: hypothetical protein ACLQVD_21935 [Capsulimonadaceae bacterium]